MTNPKILILGNMREGKDQFAEYLCKHMQTTYVSSSVAALEYIFPIIDHALNNKYSFAAMTHVGQFDIEYAGQLAFVDRGEHRELWKRAIQLLCVHDKTALTRLIFSKNDLYVGQRCILEHQACVADKLFDYVFWIDAKDRVGNNDPTLTIPFDSSYMHFIDNNGSLEDLNFKARDIADYIRSEG